MSLKLAAHERLHVLSRKLKPFSISPSIYEPPMPVCLDARRIVRGDSMDWRYSIRKGDRNLLEAAFKVIGPTDLVDRPI